MVLEEMVGQFDAESIRKMIVSSKNEKKATLWIDNLVVNINYKNKTEIQSINIIRCD